MSCDVTDRGSSTAAADAVEAACAAALSGRDPASCLVRVECSGAVDAALCLDVATLQHAVRERLGIAFLSVEDRTTAAVDLELLAEERSARGAFVRSAQTAMAAADAAEAAVLRDAIRYGLAALAGAEVGLR